MATCAPVHGRNADKKHSAAAPPPFSLPQVLEAELVAKRKHKEFHTEARREYATRFLESMNVEPTERLRARVHHVCAWGGREGLSLPSNDVAVSDLVGRRSSPCLLTTPVQSDVTPPQSPFCSHNPCAAPPG